MPTVQSACGAAALAKAVRPLYDEGQTDYSFEPLVLVDEVGKPVGRIADGDAVIFCLRRGEREVQLTEAFTDPDLAGFSRAPFKDLSFVILTLYHEKFRHLPIAFAPTGIGETLAEIVSRRGLRQLHTSESEKYAHVTFFFNGGSSQPFPGEDDVRVPSPKGVPYEQIPQLSLGAVTEQVLSAVERRYDLVVCNIANGDVIGHTANRMAKVQCAEFVDSALERIVSEARRSGYVTLITADHGNLEAMINPDGTPHVSHTDNPVDFVLVDPCAPPPARLHDGTLADVAPTVLSALGIPQPAAMSGTNLAHQYDWNGRRSVLLLILDGWGIGNQDETNPIYLAETPFWDDLLRDQPHSRLAASGEAVGLKPGKAGNSEAGHMNMGAGRLILQDDVRLDLALKDGSFSRNEIFLQTFEKVRKRGSSLHLIGLLTEKSSHGSIDYPLALLEMAREAGLKQVYLHLIFDGRSTQPGSAPLLLEKLEARLDQIGLGTVVTGVGRGIALDRDGDYAKTQRAFDALVTGTGRKYAVK